MIEGAVFDMDGVLVDNAVYHIRAWQELGRELGKNLTDTQVRAVFGQRNIEMLAALIGDSLTPEQVLRYGDRKEVIYRRLMTPALVPVTGLMEFLAELKNEGFKSAVATSAPEDNVNLVMDALKLRPWFDVVVTGAEVARGKPDPDIFLLAVRRLNLEARQCVVFEDSISGIEAARRAGSPCCALATTHSTEELSRFSPSRIIPDFSGLRATDLQEAWHWGGTNI
jgi:beta-phosphoglucomutase